MQYDKHCPICDAGTCEHENCPDCGQRLVDLVDPIGFDRSPRWWLVFGAWLAFLFLIAAFN